MDVELKSWRHQGERGGGHLRILGSGVLQGPGYQLGQKPELKIHDGDDVLSVGRGPHCVCLLVTRPPPHHSKTNMCLQMTVSVYPTPATVSVKASCLYRTRANCVQLNNADVWRMCLFLSRSLSHTRFYRNDGISVFFSSFTDGILGPNTKRANTEHEKALFREGNQRSIWVYEAESHHLPDSPPADIKSVHPSRADRAGARCSACWVGEDNSGHMQGL